MALSKVDPNSFDVNSIGQYGGRRNLIINGAMQVAQRGNTFDPSTSGTYSLDRWHATSGSSFDFDATVTQSTDAPAGFAYSLKADVNSVQTPTGGHNAAFQQKFEGQDLQHLQYGTSGAKDLTMSFWVKSNKTGIYSVGSTHPDASGAYQVKEYTIDSADTWEYKTITIEGDTSNTITNDHTLSLYVYFNLATGADDKKTPTTSWTSSGGIVGSTNQVNLFDSTSNYWQVTGVQLEVGSVATPFEHRSYGEELSLCQRYFWSLNSNGSSYKYLGLGCNYNASATYAHFPFPTIMRTTPSLTPSDGTHFQVVSNETVTNATSLTISGSTTNQGAVVLFSASLVKGYSSLIRTDENTNTYLWFDAEL
jgi:hypothetical protein